MTKASVEVNCWSVEGRHIGEIEADLATHRLKAGNRETKLSPIFNRFSAFRSFANNYTRWQSKAGPGCQPVKFQNGDVIFISVFIKIFVDLHGSSVECFIVCLSFLTNQNWNIFLGPLILEPTHPPGIDESPRSKIESRKRNLKFSSRISKGERELRNSYLEFKNIKRNLKFLSRVSRGEREIKSSYFSRI